MTIKKVVQVDFSSRLGFTTTYHDKHDFRKPTNSLKLIIQARFDRSIGTIPSFEHAPLRVYPLGIEQHNEFGVVPIITSQHYDSYEGGSYIRKIEHYNLDHPLVCFEFRDTRHLNLFKLSGGLEKFIDEYNTKIPKYTRSSMPAASISPTITTITFMDWGISW